MRASLLRKHLIQIILVLGILPIKILQAVFLESKQIVVLEQPLWSRPSEFEVKKN